MVKTRSASCLAEHGSSSLTRVVPQVGTYSDEEGPVPGLTGLAPSCAENPRKRRRENAGDVKPPKKPRRRGRLELLPTMNLDVLFHILSFLHPMDLLNLSRTSKDFRNLLMQRSSATAWKTARLQVDNLPDCPPDMTEPQYANLVFYPHCHGCDKVVRTVFWYLRVRYCSGCLDSNTVERGSVSWMGFCLSNYLPSEVFEQQRHYKLLYLRKTYDEFIAECSIVPDDKMNAFLEEKLEYVEEVIEHAKQCQEWSQSVASSRKNELAKLRHDRREAIIARIIEAGYKPELDFLGISSFEKKEKALFKPPKVLTTQAWNRICLGLIPRLDAYRNHRLDEQVYNPRRKILIHEYERYLQQPPPGAAFDVMPNIADVAEFDPFKDLIKSPESTTITASSFLPAFQQLPDLVSSWRAKIELKFMDHIHFPENDGHSGQQNGPDVLHLANSVFVVQSGEDRRLLMYPEVLSWPGFSNPPKTSCGNEFSLPKMKSFDCVPWSATLYPTTIGVFEGTAAVVWASGLDPKTAYRKDMDRLDARFSCGKCSSPGRKVIMKWEMAVMHSYRMHRDVKPGELEWTVIEGDELASIKNYEHEHEHEADIPLIEAIVYCALCQHHIGDREYRDVILYHLEHTHGIPLDKAERGTHYIADPSSISVTAFALDSNGKVSQHVDYPTVGSYCGNKCILRYYSHQL